MTALRIDHLDSPGGTITLVVPGDTLCALDFFDPEGTIGPAMCANCAT